MRSISETLTERLPDKVKNRIPIRADSLDRFIELVEEHGGPDVEAEPIVKRGKGHSFPIVGDTGDVKYSVIFTTYTPDGRKIIHKRSYENSSVSTHGRADAERRKRYADRGTVIAETGLLDIKERLPNVRTFGPALKMGDKNWEIFLNNLSPRINASRLREHQNSIKAPQK